MGDEKEGELGTPINLLDIELNGIQTVSFPSWHTIPVDHAQNYEKVAYMPIQAHYMRKYLGAVLLVLASLTMGLYVLGNAVLIAYTGFKQAHNDAEAEKKRLDANYDVIAWRLSMWNEQKGTNIFGYCRFVMKSIFYILTNFGFVY